MDRIVRQRLASQQFESSQFKQPVDVIHWLGAIQAQDYNGAKWSVGLRLPSCSDAVVERAISAGEIIRTWAVRGTLHFVDPEDIRWLLALLAPRIIAKNARRYRQLELDEYTMARSNELLARALEDGSKMDRQQLRSVVEDNGISTAGQRMFYMLQRASIDGLICQGAADKNRPSFVRLDAPKASEARKSREEALTELATRYFTGHGPATLDDFVWWSGLFVADARAGLDEASSELVKESIEGKTYWMSRTALDSPITAKEIQLLPGFDEYLVGYRDRSAVLDEQFVEMWSKGKAMFSPSIILRGKVAGLWSRTLKKNSATITPELFVDLAADDEEALADAAESYSRFLGKTLTLQL